MGYHVLAPPAVLQRHVRYFWIYELNSHHQEVAIESFADRYPRLIYQDIENFAPIKTESGQALPATYLSGIDIQKTTYTVGGQYAHVGVSFYPHALHSLFRIDAHELVNELPDLCDLHPTNLNDRLNIAANHYERVVILSHYLIEKLNKQVTVNALVQQSLWHAPMEQYWSVQQLLKQHSVSERQLERLFKRSVGVSPKTYLRLTRFEQALHRLKGMVVDSLDIVCDLGYSDHSHFIREFKEFSGFTPKQFIAKETLGRDSSSFVLVN
ncbi:hypothetical protein GCM10027347_50130 [Larkinella harenae]